MADSRTYNTFYKGIKEDNFLTSGANFIEGNNVTGLNDGYDITIGPKVTKGLLTNGNAPRTIFGDEQTDASLDSIAIGCDTGEIYNLGTSVDNVAEYTLTNSWNILNGTVFGANMYFASKDPASNACKLAQVELNRFIDGTFTGINESFLDFFNFHTPPILITSGFMYIGGSSKVYRYNSSLTKVTYSIFDGNVIGITVHGTQLMVYTSNGIVSYWDGSTAGVTANIKLGFTPERVWQESGLDHVITTDGDYYIGSGYNFQLITNARQSRRLEDNSQYINKFDFTPDAIIGQPLATARGGLFMISADTKPGIYRKEELIQGLPEGYHKSITKDNANIDFDELFTLSYLGEGQSKLFFGYQSGSTTYGVDSIDLNTRTSGKDGYIISDVFTGGTTFSKQIDKVRITTSYTDGTSNYIKLYVRKDNASSWTLLRTINDTTSAINRISITEATGNFIDIQFKVEFHNEDQDNTPPLMHELYLEYTVNKNNG